MKNFKEFNIVPTFTAFVGDKIKLSKVINTEIIINDYKIKDSEKRPGTKYLTLQITRKGEKEVIFTAAKTLMDMIEQVPKDEFPFMTTITQDDQMYQFT
ncbi:hypothetical protein PF438_04195 [Elizabethkingia meningoseptica]|uniref:hypothetical protein n=1 Tax=Elizabethkingia meningoseptica TaxID=238 RepID=UPI0022F1A810|nr:hypothetical protein [Elizabethkingia meningoseptica]EJK5330524.1 hypothetical protein [Elizabethkingia meningoseptica]WBS75693.1 hypothetical protein PF438_04195 [Elizabethkingia meningoseptica]